VLIRSASTITAALLAGETPMIQLGGNGTIQAALQGADCVNVLTLVPLIPQSLVVTPDIKTPEDLKNQKMAPDPIYPRFTYPAARELEFIELFRG
jgi:ABC-type taurine transport system substrate-binding protein